MVTSALCETVSCRGRAQRARVGVLSCWAGLGPFEVGWLLTPPRADQRALPTDLGRVRCSESLHHSQHRPSAVPRAASVGPPEARPAPWEAPGSARPAARPQRRGDQGGRSVSPPCRLPGRGRAQPQSRPRYRPVPPGADRRTRGLEDSPRGQHTHRGTGRPLPPGRRALRRRASPRCHRVPRTSLVLPAAPLRACPRKTWKFQSATLAWATATAQLRGAGEAFCPSSRFAFPALLRVVCRPEWGFGGPGLRK